MNSDLTDSILQGSIVEDSSFSEAIMLRTNFSGSKLKGRLFSAPDFLAAKAKDANFSKCNIYGVTMLDADFENADFSKSNIEIMDIQSANLQNAKFIDSSLNAVNFGHADLTNADFTQATFVDYVRLTDANLEGAIFDYVTLINNPRIDLTETIYEGKSLPIKKR
jgi:uncharacterized protein YjbI with pentapeptide repeats